MPAYPHRQAQSGAAFIIMLVILVMGISAFFVGTTSKMTLQIARNNQSNDLLVQAKEVVIGYAVNGTGSSQRPGDLLRPDVLGEGTPNYDGTSDGCLNFNNAPSGLPTAPIPAATDLRCLGRLPWKDYGMSVNTSSQNDSLGVMPWYAAAPNVMDDTLLFNSELLNKTTGWLTVRDMNGNVLSNRVVFIIIIPGSVISGQSRPPAPNLAGADQYLDSITVPNGCTAPCVPGVYKNADLDNSFIMGGEHRWITVNGQQIEDATYQFNDRLLYVTIDELMPLIEKRIAREVKACLDDYAAVSNDKYPWASPVSDTTDYFGKKDVRFGRIPSARLNVLTNNSDILSFIDALNQLQAALNIYNSSHTGTNLNNLKDAGEILKNASDPAPSGISNSVENSAHDAGQTADNLSSSPSNSTLNSIQNDLNDAYSGLDNDNLIDGGMRDAWRCALLSTQGNYWDNWKNLFFYQLASGYKPGTSTPSCGSSCLSIIGTGNPNSGSGEYRATITLAGKILPTQTNPRLPTQRTDYLEASNEAGKNNSPSSLTFETYKSIDSSFININDQVLCLDKKTNCK